MTIKVEITANDAVGLASQLHEFVQTFTKLAAPTPFDSAPAPVQATPLPVEQTEPEQPKRKRQSAKVIEADPPAKVEESKPEAANDEPSLDDVRAVLNELRSKKGNDALGKVVTQFAPKFSEVPASSYPALFREAKKALAA
jgi:hypothetical protein